MTDAIHHLPKTGPHMPEVDDRYERDRHARATATGIDQVNEKLYGVRESVSVMMAKFEGLADQVNKGFAEVNTTIRTFNTKYVSREEHEALKGDFKDFKTNIVRLNMLVISLFLVAVAVLVFKAGLVKT